MSESQTRILVVDDDPDLRDLLTGYLAREGFAVAGAEDGRAMDAVLAETAARRRPDTRAPWGRTSFRGSSSGQGERTAQPKSRSCFGWTPLGK